MTLGTGHTGRDQILLLLTQRHRN